MQEEEPPKLKLYLWRKDLLTLIKHGVQALHRALEVLKIDIIPYDRERASQLDISASVEVALQAITINNLYIGDLATKLEASSEMIAAKDRQLKEKDKVIENDVAKYETKDRQLKEKDKVIENDVAKYERDTSTLRSALD
ncbi:hypothetical protein Scep_017423 [Stephania cephalantha]|uniref:Uncharacterized protein n=1 Tax=Stephania cephalantha TaxID=152367 RepID=A0AAP0IQ16_9MAGN